MEEELNELRELVAQLRADNEKLRQERAFVASPGLSIDPGDASALPVAPPVQSVGAGPAERFFLYQGTGSALNSMADQALALASGLRRLRPVFEFVIYLFRIRLSFYLITWRGRHERRFVTVLLASIVTQRKSLPHCARYTGVLSPIWPCRRLSFRGSNSKGRPC